MYDSIWYHNVLTCKGVIKSIIKFEDFILNCAVALMISSIYKWNNIIWIMNEKIMEIAYKMGIIEIMD